MKKLTLTNLTLFVLLLSACGKPDSVVVTSSKYMVVMPDKEMFVCDPADPFPQAETLTDVIVAKTITNLYQNNVKCRQSIVVIQKFLEDAKKMIAEGKDPTEKTH